MKRFREIFGFFGSLAVATAIFLLLGSPILAFLWWVHPIGAAIAQWAIPLVVLFSLFFVGIVMPALDAAYDMGSGSAQRNKPTNYFAVTSLAGFVLAAGLVAHWLSPSSLLRSAILAVDAYIIAASVCVSVLGGIAWLIACIIVKIRR